MIQLLVALVPMLAMVMMISVQMSDVLLVYGGWKVICPRANRQIQRERDRRDGEPEKRWVKVFRHIAVGCCYVSNQTHSLATTTLYQKASTTSTL